MRPQPPAPDVAARRRPARALGGLALALGLLAAGCGDGNGGETPSTSAPATSTPGSPSPSASPSTSPTPSASPTRTTTAPPPKSPTPAPASCVDTATKAMSDAQRVGQLFMSGVSAGGLTTAQANAITRGRTGAVILTGRSSAGAAAVKKITDRVRALAPSVRGVKVGMLVATDQEGGKVQVLTGRGFSRIPSAVVQGGWSTATLRSRSTTWARQLRAAGVDMNLAPVADTVPADLTKVNEPIGKLDREFGHTPSAVASHSTAFLRGMVAGGVVPTAKHFPGLGLVRGNTDTTADVKDTVTTRDDPNLLPFRDAVGAGTPFVMVSSAIYTRIDPAHQAAFSSTVIRGMLRDSLGFKGAVISDDLGQAVAVADHTPAQRAVDFIAAGGSMVLTVIASDIAPMTSAVLARMAKDTGFRKDVDDAVRRVLTAKNNAGLLSCG